MEKRTRQRVTGVALLLILAAVLSPLVFRSPEQIRTALNMEIPPQPDFQTVAVEPVVSEKVENAARERLESDRQAVLRQAPGAEASQEPGAEEGERSSLSDQDDNPGSDPDSLTTLATPPGEDRQPGDDPILAGFVVQVGSFTRQDSADGLVERLKQAGYRAYTEKDSINGKLLHRVMVGPEIRKADAEKNRQSLENDSRFNIKGLVRIYAP